MTSSATIGGQFPMRRILRIWWPLAASWLIMTGEIPMMAAVVARLPNPRVHLAAWGIVFPMALILASPIMMFLAASTTLCKDWPSYATLRRYMIVLAGAMTVIHVLLAYTPLFALIVTEIIAAPPEVLAPAQLGFRIMVPWTFSLAYRRFNYGVLIRFEHTRAVTLGSLVRLCVDAVTLLLLYSLGTLPGIAVATAGISMGVVGEAIYSHWRVRPVVGRELRLVPPVADVVTLPFFLRFYVPLVMTSLLQIGVQPLISAALSRMPDPLQSLAVWPVIYGVLIMFMSTGIAFTEVVVVLLDEPRSIGQLRRFALLLGGTVVTILVLANLTPLAGIWFGHVVALPFDLVERAKIALWLSVLVPGIAVLEGGLTGVILNSKRTRGITEAMALGLVVNVTVLAVGIGMGTLPGIFIGSLALTIGALTRVVWLWRRARPAIRAHVRGSMWQPLAPV